MNPLFNNMRGMGDVIRLYKQVKQNPSMLGELLYQNGRIDQSQMEAMKGMNPAQMGDYLRQNGVLSQSFLQKGNQFANPVRQSVT